MAGNVLEGRDFEKEFIFNASRSSGPGGQNVNKVNTRVELRFSIGESHLLNENEKKIILEKLASRINKEGSLILSSQVERSQTENRQRTIDKFYSLINKALTPVKKRIPTRPGTVAIKKRLESKRINSRKKELRRTVDDL